MATFSQQLQQAKLNADRKIAAILQKDRRKAEKLAEKSRLARQNVPDGLTNGQRAALVAAEKRMETDPRAMALVDRAETERRVQEVRKRLKVGKLPPPPPEESMLSRIETARPDPKRQIVRPVAELLAERRALQPAPAPVVEQPESRDTAPAKAAYVPPAQRREAKRKP